MKAIFDDRQWKHDPKHFMANGTVYPNPEQLQRIEVLHSGAEAAGCSFQAPADHGMGPSRPCIRRNISSFWKPSIPTGAGLRMR